MANTAAEAHALSKRNRPWGGRHAGAALNERGKGRESQSGVKKKGNEQGGGGLMWALGPGPGQGQSLRSGLWLMLNLVPAPVSSLKPKPATLTFSSQPPYLHLPGPEVLQMVSSRSLKSILSSTPLILACLSVSWIPTIRRKVWAHETSAH